MFSLIPWKKKDETTGLVPQGDFPLGRLRGEFDTLFDRFFGNLGPLWGGGWTPDRWGLGLEERDKDYLVRAEVPGFEPEDLDVQVSGQLLTIRAETRQDQGGDQPQQSYRTYHQSVTLPAGAQTDGIEARYRNGVLEVRVPKSEQAQARRITVQA